MAYPELDVQELNRSLPVPKVLDDFVQAELMIERGDGECDAAPDGLGMVGAKCEPLESSAQDSLNVMLWTGADELTEAMFAAGADRALSETVTGYSVTTSSTFTYRMTAWRLLDEVDHEETPAWKLMASCANVATRSFLGSDRLVLDAGRELAVVLWRDADIIYLVESIRPLTPDGAAQRYEGTESGLLPTSAINAIQVWWSETAPVPMGATTTDATT